MTIRLSDKELVERAAEAAGNSICPFSGFRVGAAILSSDGRLFIGCNIENMSLSMSVCAEQVAMMKALSDGIREFARIAIWADSEDYVTPCGKCRQLLFEFAPTIEVIMANREYGYIKEAIAELLPRAFQHR